MLFAIERSSYIEEGIAEPPVEEARWDDIHECWVIDVQSLDDLIALAEEENPRWQTLTIRAPVEDVPGDELPFIEIDDTILDDVTG